MPAVLDDQRRTPPAWRPAAAPGGVIPVDRASPVPLYFQVAQYLEEAIESGLMPPGSWLGNEGQMAAELRLSRPTVRRAVQYLVDRGLVVRQRGIGTKVVQTQVKRPIELSSLYDDLNRTGRRPATTVLANTVEPAAAQVAHVLNLPVGAPVIALDRLRYAGGEPIARLRNYLPGTVAGLTTQALEETGLYLLIRSVGIRLHAAVQTIGARTADADEAQLLHESVGAPLLTMQRITYDEHGNAVEWGRHVYRASRYCFEQNLVTH